MPGSWRVDPVDGSEPWTAFANEERNSLARGGIELTCETPETALRLAQHLRWPHSPDS